MVRSGGSTDLPAPCMRLGDDGDDDGDDDDDGVDVGDGDVDVDGEDDGDADEIAHHDELVRCEGDNDVSTCVCMCACVRACVSHGVSMLCGLAG